MQLLKSDTNEIIKARIEQFKEKDLITINTLNNFVFDWKIEMSNEVYKITSIDNENIYGLISLIDIPDELRIHIQLIESSIENIGKNKQIENIPGCLVAFSCKKSFEKGYEGFVSLLPKTKLINHYQDKYGFRQFGRMLAVEGNTAIKLILKYLYNEV